MRHEMPHYTPEQVAEHLAEAARLVAEAGLPPAFHVVAFTKALDLLAQKQIIVEQVQPGLPNLGNLRGGH